MYHVNNAHCTVLPETTELHCYAIDGLHKGLSVDLMNSKDCKTRVHVIPNVQTDRNSIVCTHYTPPPLYSEKTVFCSFPTLDSFSKWRPHMAMSSVVVVLCILRMVNCYYDNYINWQLLASKPATPSDSTRNLRVNHNSCKDQIKSQFSAKSKYE